MGLLAIGPVTGRPAIAAPDYIWMSPGELAASPTSGVAWTRLLTQANKPITAPLISNQDDDSDVLAFAKALVFARTGDETYRAAVRSAI